MRNLKCSCQIWIVFILLFSVVHVPTVLAKDKHVTVVAGDVQGLNDVIKGANDDAAEAVGVANEHPDRTVITIVPDNGINTPFNLTVPYQSGSSSAFAPILGANLMIQSGLGSLGKSIFLGMPSFRAFEVDSLDTANSDFANLAVYHSIFLGFGSLEGDGGTFLVRRGKLTIAETYIGDSHVPLGFGGAIALDYFAFLDGMNVMLSGNSAGKRGGAISARNFATIWLDRATFDGNIAIQYGCDVYSDPELENVDSIPDPALKIESSTFLGGGDCKTASIESVAGRAEIRNTTVAEQNQEVGHTEFAADKGPFEFWGSILFPPIPGQSEASVNDSGKNIIESLCDQSGTGEYISHGYNIGGDGSCELDHPTDLPGVDPLVAEPDAEGMVALLPGSPAIESGASDLIMINGKLVLPCGPSDIRGLGRPQDSDGDGVFECDRGSYEVQGGPALTAGQSAAFFDPSRSGEGIFMEMLGNDSVLVSFFTYSPHSSGLAWFLAVGKVVGNTVVVDEFLQPIDGVWGEGFDTNAINSKVRGSLSLVFPSCEGLTTPGRMVYSGDATVGLEPLLVVSERLSTIVNCDTLVAVPNGGLSGAFFDPDRSGEGIFVQWLSADSVLVIMFTFDPEGNQFWFISSDTVVSGTKVTATMIYPATPTGFGSEFDASELEFQTWGTMTLDYIGCDAMTFTVTPEIAGFTPHTYDYKRLTRLAGTSCP